MSPEIRNCEKYSFSTDVFSFGVLACEYFSSDSHKIIKEANEKHERPVLEFIPDKRLRSLLEFCVDDDPMSRPSFDFICKFLFKKFIKNTSMEAKLEELTRIPRIDEDKLNQIRVLASRGSCEAIIEYGKYLLRENKFDDAMHVFLLGANEGDAYCQNTFGVLSKTNIITSQIINEPEDFIKKAAECENVFGLVNFGFMKLQDGYFKESIKLLELAYSKGMAFARYLLGLIYEKKNINGLTFDERIKKAIELYRDAAKEGDAFAQYKFGLCLEEGLAVDDDGYDCVHYFRQSAYQRCRSGIKKYVEYLEGKRKEYYRSLQNMLEKSEFHYLWEDEQDFFEEMMSCHTGMMLYDKNSGERFGYLNDNIFYYIFRKCID